MFSALSSKWNNTQVQDKNKLYVLFRMKYGVQYALTSKEEKKKSLSKFIHSFQSQNKTTSCSS